MSGNHTSQYHSNIIGFYGEMEKCFPFCLSTLSPKPCSYTLRISNNNQLSIFLFLVIESIHPSIHPSIYLSVCIPPPSLPQMHSLDPLTSWALTYRTDLFNDLVYLQ